MQAGLSQEGSSMTNVSAQKKSYKVQRNTDEQWNAEVQDFLEVVNNNDASAREIRFAWEMLRQKYSKKFNATAAYPSNTSTNLEPFPLWAAETFDDAVLNHVLRVEFADQLAHCTFMSLFRSTAAMADVSIWHLILYFGMSIFSESRIKALRKRKHVFTQDVDGTTWPFTKAYKNMLRQAATKQRLSLDTTTLPCCKTPAVFSSTDLFNLAPNQEFQSRPQAKAKSEKRGVTGVPLGSRGGEEARKGKSKGKGKEREEEEAEKASVPTLAPILTQRQEQCQGEGERSLQVPRRQMGNCKEELASMQPTGRVTWGDHRVQSTVVPQKRFPAADNHLDAGSLDALVPSIEPAEQKQGIKDESFRNDDAPTTSLNTGVQGNVQGSGRLTRAQKLDRQLVKRVASQGMNEAHAANVFRLQREVSFNPTAAGTPLLRKRRVKQENDEGGPSKRLQLGENQRAAAAAGSQHVSTHPLGRSQEWTDATILEILKKLETIRSEEVIVVDGMKPYSHTNHPSSLTATDIGKGSILLPLKLLDGYRILAFLRLDVINSSGPSGKKPKQGTILFYDPTQNNAGEFIRGYQLAARVAQILGYVLPAYDADPTAWDMHFCPMPAQQTKGNTGIAICLAAMCIVGSLPRMAQIPEEVDWTFWRHFIFSCFHGSDKAVSTQMDNYRFQTVQSQIHQGQVRGRTPEHRDEDDDEIECVGHITRDPMLRIIHRELNAQRLLQAVHQSHIICLNLMSHVERGMTLLKINLDKSRVLRQAAGVSAHTASDTLKREEHTPEQAFHPLLDQSHVAEFPLDQYNDCQLTLEDAARYLTKAIDEASVWRNAIQQAVHETNENIA